MPLAIKFAGARVIASVRRGSEAFRSGGINRDGPFLRRDAAQPYPAYDQMRSGSPVFHLPPFDLWMIFDFEGVKRVLMEHDTFSSDLSHAPGQGNAGEWFIFFDPPRHTKLRALISKAFTPRVVANLEPRIRELSRQLLDQTIERGQMDLATDFSVPLPMLVITEMIGVPVADWPRYKRWSDVIVKLANTYRDTVIVAGSETAVWAGKMPIAGQTSHLRITSIWMKQGGRWQHVSRHVNIIVQQ